MSSTISEPGKNSKEKSVRHTDALAVHPENGAHKGALPILLAQNGFVADSIVDGPGLRCTLFVQGCPHACPGCHNPATHPFEGGEPATATELYHRIAQHPLCKAVTLSGGEPFCQAEALAPLAALLKNAGYQLAAYTGYTFRQLCTGTPAHKELLGLLDTLIDGPYIEAERDLTLRFRGSRNQRILNIPQSLAAGAAVLETAERWTGKPPTSH